MDKYVIIKLEEKEYAKSYDDIKEDKYLTKFVLDGSPYPYKSWTPNIEYAMWFFEEDDAKKICSLLKVNTPYPLRVEKHNL